MQNVYCNDRQMGKRKNNKKIANKPLLAAVVTAVKRNLLRSHREYAMSYALMEYQHCKQTAIACNFCVEWFSKCELVSGFLHQIFARTIS